MKLFWRVSNKQNGITRERPQQSQIDWCGSGIGSSEQHSYTLHQLSFENLK
jgi:hypothetical protein